MQPRAVVSSTSEAVRSPDAPPSAQPSTGSEKKEDYSKSLVVAKLKASTTEFLSPDAKAALKLKSKMLRSKKHIQSSKVDAYVGKELMTTMSSDAVQLAGGNASKVLSKDAAPKSLRSNPSEVLHFCL